MLKRLVLYGFLAFTVFYVALPTAAYAISLDDDEEDTEDVADLLEQAKKAGANESFDTANTLLKKAKMYGVSIDDTKEASNYIAQKKQARDKRLERERKEHERLARLKREKEERARQTRLAQQRADNEGDLKDRCAIVIGNNTAYWACTKNIGGLQGLGDRGLNALFATRKQCNYLAGNDSTGLSYLCSNPNKNGCIGLEASQNTINACYQCGGSNLWLRVYAAGTVLKCY